MTPLRAGSAAFNITPRKSLFLFGYLVTSEAAAEGGYEAAGALFKSPDSGNLLASRTRELLKSWKD